MNDLQLQGKRIKVFCKNKFVYSGIVTAETADFIIFDDYKTQTERILAKIEISDIEVL